MSEANETLERAAHILDQIGLKGAHWANIHVRSGGAVWEYEADYLKYLPDAIREVLAEVERLRAELEARPYYWGEPVKIEIARLEAENSQLRAAFNGLGQDFADRGDRIEAALALHAAKVDPESPSRYCPACSTVHPCPTVKALKGE